MQQPFSLHDVFYPKNVAVVGASENPVKLGFQSLMAVKTGGLSGKIFPVSPSLRGKEIMGIPAYGDISELPEDAQLMVFAIPHDRIPGALESAAKKGARGVVIFAGGFREVGGRGEELQQEIREIANKNGIAIIGPNCVGTVNTHHGLNATFAHPLSLLTPGRVTVVSQSGGTGSAIITMMMDNNVGIAKFVSIGNRVNLDFPEITRYLADDDETDVICLFVEGMDDGRGFLEVARRVSKKKPILVYQAGFTETAKKLALSHTGSMSSSEDIYRAAYRQAGVLFVGDYEELVDTAKALSSLPPLGGPGVAIFTHTAGPALIVAEAVERVGGVLPDYRPENKKRLLKFVPEFTTPTNPLDMFAHAWVDSSLYVRATDIALSQPDIHLACACYSGGSEMGILFPAAEYAGIAQKHGKPAVVCLMAPFIHRDELVAADEAGAPTFNNPHKAGRTIANLITLWRMRNRR
jgi:acyl-CoA synthetase (NDP forming)